MFSLRNNPNARFGIRKNQARGAKMRWFQKDSVARAPSTRASGMLVPDGWMTY
jgi:hypothetical protein